MRVPHTTNRESSDSILNSLALRHDADGRYYREGAGAVGDEDLRNALQSFAHYRHELYREVNELLEDMPSIPSTPSRQGESYLQQNQQAYETALRSANRSQLSSFVYETEKDLSDYYRVALDTEGLNETVRSLLERQHQKVLDFMLKAERMESVPLEGPNKLK